MSLALLVEDFGTASLVLSLHCLLVVSYGCDSAKGIETIIGFDCPSGTVLCQSNAVGSRYIIERLVVSA